MNTPSKKELGEYTRDTLLEGENILYKAKVSPATLLVAGTRVLFGIIFISIPIGVFGEIFLHTHGLWLFLILPPLQLIDPVISLQTSEFVITDKRIIAKVGFLQSRSVELFISKIEAVNVDQSYLGNLLNFGSITIHGTGGTREILPNIEHPLEFRKWIQKTQIN
jgi:uncharacterized membrane protein YdbT with pleckstrin-like domain